MQAGKKKLVLDHLIVQKMDEDDAAGDDVQSILTFGAKALFEEGAQGAHDIICTFILLWGCGLSQVFILDTDHDIEKLIEKTEQQGDQEEPEKKDDFSFAFAKIWAADKDTLEEMDDTVQSNDKDDSWAQTLAVSFIYIYLVDYNIDYQLAYSRGARKGSSPRDYWSRCASTGCCPSSGVTNLFFSCYTL